jgi:outer membrane protein TolC
MWRIAVLALLCALVGNVHFSMVARADVGASEPAPVQPSAAGLPKIDLKRALDEALQREVHMSVARAELARAEALVTKARAAMLPTLVGHGSYLRLDHERSANGVLVAGRDQLLADLTLNVPLVVVKPWVETGHAKDAVGVSRFELEDVRRRVALATAQAYLTVIAQHRNIEVQERALENARDHYRYAHTRLEGGIGNEIDDVRAGQEVESSAALLEASRAALYQAQEALSVLVGRDGAVDVADAVALPSPPNLHDALADAATRRGDVQAGAAQVKATRRTIDDDWVEYAPFLTAQALPFYHEPGVVSAPHTGWQVQLLLTIPFYDGGFRYGLFAERAANLQQDKAEFEHTLRTAKSEVRTGLDAVMHADVALSAATRASDLAGRALKMANLAYEAGASTNIEVIDAERRARDAATVVVIAEDASRQARLDLLAASGRFP